MLGCTHMHLNDVRPPGLYHSAAHCLLTSQCKHSLQWLGNSYTSQTPTPQSGSQLSNHVHLSWVSKPYSQPLLLLGGPLPRARALTSFQKLLFVPLGLWVGQYWLFAVSSPGCPVPTSPEPMHTLFPSLCYVLGGGGSSGFCC